MKLFVLLLLAIAMPVSAQREERTVVLGADDSVLVVVTRTQTNNAGAAVLIVPGLIGGEHSFRKLTDSLSAAGHDVYLVDILAVPNNETRAAKSAGNDFSLESFATRLAAVVDSLRIDRFMIVTHALGGGISYRLSLQRPDKVAGIIAIEAGPAETAGSPSIRNALRYSTIIKVLGARRMIEKSVRDGMKKSAHTDGWITDALIRRYVAPHAIDFNATVRVFRAMVDSREPQPLAPRLSQIKVPVVLMLSDPLREGSMPQDQMDELQKLPNLRVERVTGTGPYIQEERTDAVMDQVRELSANADKATGAPRRS